MRPLCVPENPPSHRRPPLLRRWPSTKPSGISIIPPSLRAPPAPGCEDVDTALVNGELKFSLQGVKLKGSWVLVRTHSDGYPEGRTWLLIKHRDQWAGEVDVVEAAPDSVKSFGDFADILAKNKPAIWDSNRPSRSGATGKMLAEIIEQAAERKASAR